MIATLHLFPLDKRIGKIRSTATKMLAKTTDRHAAFYREQVSMLLYRLNSKKSDSPKKSGRCTSEPFGCCAGLDGRRQSS